MKTRGTNSSHTVPRVEAEQKRHVAQRVLLKRKAEIRSRLSLVSFVKVKSDAGDSIREGIMRSLDLIDYSFAKRTSRVVIKPNLCYYFDYSTGQTTDPKFVAAVIDLIRDKISPDTDISIVESDASAMKCKYAFKILGYEKLSKEYGVPLINLSNEPHESASFAAGKQSFRFMVPRVIRDATLRINIPKIKYTVEGLKITCALKNIYGCNPFQKKFVYHRRIDEAIVALNKAMGFDLCIIDAIVVSGVQPRKLGLIMASTDAVAIDAAAAKIAGVNPKGIEYLKLAAEEGLGKMAITPCGESLEYFRDRYPRKNVTNKLRKKASDLLIRTGMNKRIGL
jgi:uncharacterized protein (DUF362 family)